MGAWLAFGLIAVALLGAAVMVVSSRDLVRGVLWLAVALLTTAVAYVVLHADFLAAAQVLLYTGGVVTLMLFAVMLTRRLSGARVEVVRGQGGARGPIVAVLLFALLATTLVRAPPLVGAPVPSPTDTQGLGALFLTELVLPFELLGMLLLAAMVGAIVLARVDGPARRIPRLPSRLPPERQP